MKIHIDILAEIRRLVLREEWQIETVARRFGVHHSVVRRALRETPVEEIQQVETVLDPYKEYLVRRITEHPNLSGVRLYKEIQERGYEGGIATMRRYVARMRPPRPRKAFLSVETEPGEQAQVDWGSFGKFRVKNTYRPLSVFSMVMSWSRAIYIDFSLDQRMDTFLRMHKQALEFFGGVPRRILYDNLKSVVLHHVGKVVQFNPQFLAFAGHYLFEPVAAPVRYPEAKGKVESSIRYIRHSFFYGRSFSSIEDLREKAAAWRDSTANTRIHATTRERPAERLILEKRKLHPLPAHPYDTDLIVFPIIVPKNARVSLDTNTYSVPPGFVGRTVRIRANEKTVKVLCDSEEIAAHPRTFEKHVTVEDQDHIDEIIAKRKNAVGPRNRNRIASLSPECRTYLQEIARRNISLGNEVKRLHRLIDRYGEEEVKAGMVEALKRGTFGATYVRTLMDQMRFSRGLEEPSEPLVTGNPAADRIVVEPHALETYDAIIKGTEKQNAEKADTDSDTGSGADHVAETDPRNAGA